MNLAQCRDPKTEIGLVFSGGGLKGGYEIGVWKALLEKGVAGRITAVSGTSVGALNAMLFALGDYPYAENLWLGVTRDDLMYLPAKGGEDEKPSAVDDVPRLTLEPAEPAGVTLRKAEVLKPRLVLGSEPEEDGGQTPEEAEEKSPGFWEKLDAKRLLGMVAAGRPLPEILQSVVGENLTEITEGGVFSQQKLESMIADAATPEKLEALTMGLYVTCTKTKKLSYLLDRDDGTETVTFDLRQRPGDYRDILLASAAIPVVYPPVTIDGEKYVDGGLNAAGNTPVSPLYERGYRKIVVVYLQKKPEARIRKRDFPFAEFAEIIPGEELYTGPLAAMYMPDKGIASEIEAGYWDALGTCTFG